MRVVLASNINHSVHAAHALRELGVLHSYLGPVLFDARSAAARWARGSLRSRVFPDLCELPLKRLIRPELAARTWSRTPRAGRSTAQQRARSLDDAVVRKLPQCDVLHWHTSGLTRTVQRAMDQGALLVADHRDVHPRVHPGVDPLLSGLEYELEAAHWVLANSDYSARTLVDHGVPAEKVVVIPLGVDTRRFHPGPEMTRRSRPVVLFVGSIIRRKGVDLILDLAGQREFSGVTFRLCGPPVDEALVRVATTLSNVEFVGVARGNRLVSEYRDADVLVLPSRIDAYGLVVPEALACGTPVITTTGVGAASLVQNNGAGVVCRPEDLEGLRVALQTVLAAEGNPFRSGCAAAASEASWDRYEARLKTWYREWIPGTSVSR